MVKGIVKLRLRSGRSFSEKERKNAIKIITYSSVWAGNKMKRKLELRAPRRLFQLKGKGKGLRRREQKKTFQS
jgi:hypothetical protein